jgi:hypothetical protein
MRWTGTTGFEVVSVTGPTIGVATAPLSRDHFTVASPAPPPSCTSTR